MNSIVELLSFTNNNIFSISKKELNNISSKIGHKISRDYQNKKLVLIGLLKGSNPFLADLARNIDLPLEITYIQVSSYEKNISSQSLIYKLDIDIDIQDRDVIIVEDIIDTGLTLKGVIDLLEKRKPNSINIAVLLDKIDAHDKVVNIKYVGKIIPNVFVVGYGLDYRQYFRNLPYITSVEVSKLKELDTFIDTL
ncbi:MAG: hypoxanthine phosphoribosyltransferase [Bacillales bacterium]|jgi:hypoxanthine phosphoribosyltransferase|nr:hypoxanthine phosphoribosyltransferase [Bacillales bacterium]